MIDHGDKRINTLDQKRIHLIDKINAYFRRVKQHKDNPTRTRIELCVDFDERIDKALVIFK